VNNTTLTHFDALLESDRAEAERILRLSEQAIDGANAKAILDEETTEVMTTKMILDKLNAIREDKSYSVPSGYRLPDNEYVLSQISHDETGFHGTTDFLGINAMSYGEAKKLAKQDYLDNFCNDEAIDATFDLIREHRESNTATFSKNTLKHNKNGTTSFRLSGTLGRKMKKASAATPGEIVAHMKSKLSSK